MVTYQKQNLALQRILEKKDKSQTFPNIITIHLINSHLQVRQIAYVSSSSQVAGSTHSNALDFQVFA